MPRTGPLPVFFITHSCCSTLPQYKAAGFAKLWKFYITISESNLYLIFVYSAITPSQDSLSSPLATTGLQSTSQLLTSLIELHTDSDLWENSFRSILFSWKQIIDKGWNV